MSDVSLTYQSHIGTGTITFFHGDEIVAEGRIVDHEGAVLYLVYTPNVVGLVTRRKIGEYRDRTAMEYGVLSWYLEKLWADQRKTVRA